MIGTARIINARNTLKMICNFVIVIFVQISFISNSLNVILFGKLCQKSLYLQGNFCQRVSGDAIDANNDVAFYHDK